MTRRTLELVSLCCLAAVGFGMYVMYARLLPGSGLILDLLGSFALGLVAGANRDDEASKVIALLAAVAVFVLIGTSSATLPAFTSLNVFIIGFVPSALIGLLTLAATPRIVNLAVNVFKKGPATIDRINKIIRSTTLTLGALSALWVAIKKLLI